jgi:hypothetical protein
MGRKGTGNGGQLPEGEAKRPRTVLIEGPQTNVVYAKITLGREPAKEFYESLEMSDRVKFLNLFIRIAEHGRITSQEKFRLNVHNINCNHNGTITQYSVAEFKIHTGGGKRIMACSIGREWVLTHGFLKGNDMATEREKAGRIFCEDPALNIEYAERKRRR